MVLADEAPPAREDRSSRQPARSMAGPGWLPDLIVAVDVTLTQGVALLVRQSVERLRGELCGSGPQCIGKAGRRAHEDHGVDPRRLCGACVKKALRAHTEANCLYALDAEAVQQREDVLCALPECECAARIGRTSMAAQIRDDHAVAGRV